MYKPHNLMILTIDQKKHYKSKGFIIIKNFYNSEEIKKFQSSVKKLINTKNNKIAKYHQLNYLGTKNDLFRIENFYDHSLTLKKLIDSKKINQLLKLINKKKMILFKEKINIKPAFSREDRLHQDVQGDWLKYSKNFITILISLKNTNNKNGNLIFDISGNNKDKILGEMFKPLIKKNLNKPIFRAFPMMKGDIAMFNGFVPHMSNRNLSSRNRMQIYLTFCESNLSTIRKKYFLEKFKNCPPNQHGEVKFIFKN